MEMNASSCRNKSTIHNLVGSQVSSLSISGFLGGGASGRRHAVIMDEVDGMDGNADRGGMGVSCMETFGQGGGGGQKLVFQGGSIISNCTY